MLLIIPYFVGVNRQWEQEQSTTKPTLSATNAAPAFNIPLSIYIEYGACTFVSPHSGLEPGVADTLPEF